MIQEMVSTLVSDYGFSIDRGQPIPEDLEGVRGYSLVSGRYNLSLVYSEANKKVILLISNDDPLFVGQSMYQFHEGQEWIRPLFDILSTHAINTWGN